MANVRGPNATYIPPARIGLVLALGPWGLVLSQGSFALGSQGFHIGSVRVFGYQHVGIGNAKVSRLGYCPTRTPNTRGFTLQWNIGLILHHILCSTNSRRSEHKKDIYRNV